MCATLLRERSLCREQLSSRQVEVCAHCHHRRLYLASPRHGFGNVTGRRGPSKCSFQIRSCAVATPERHQTLYRSELGYRTDFAEQYSLQEVIGKGNFGTVWLAVSRKEPVHEVAVKIIPKSRDDRSHAETLNCIRHEVALWGALSGDSRYVAELLGLYEDGKDVYLVQQLCIGGDLSEVLQEGPLPENCCAAIMWCVLSAIRDCHDHHLALIDVKPQNFLLTASADGGSCGVRSLRLEDQVAAGSSRPCVVACDFGCSLSYTELMRGAKRAGSPVFFAPEQFTNNYSLVVDEWAAGVMLYLLLSGRYPFWDCKRENLDKALPAYQVMLAVCGAPITFTSPEWAGISREARDLVSQLLDRNPSTRLTAKKALQHPWFARWMRTSEQEDGSETAGSDEPAAAALTSGCHGMSRNDRQTQRRRRTYSRSGHSDLGRQRTSSPPEGVPLDGGCCSDGAGGMTGGAAGTASALENGAPAPRSCCCSSNIVPLAVPSSFALVPAGLPLSAAGHEGPYTGIATVRLPDDTAGSVGDDAPGCAVAHLY